jgi:DNA-binding winged helix-turn-helix (wHTH) protein
VRVRFGPFTLDSGTRQLIREGGEIRLSPKAFDVLCVLVEQRPKVVEKEELHARIWPGTFVVDTNLSILVGEIRRALADTPQQSRFIRTVHKAGYAFCGDATDLTDRRPRSVPQGAKCWLVSRDRTIVLSAGENVIGRAPQCQVWLDATGVSRQHARIEIADDGRHAWIDDLASTNGTFVKGSRVVDRQALADGDSIEVGSVTLTFRMWSAGRQKKTERIGRRE